MKMESYIGKLDKRMDSIEGKMLQPKPWYLKGEASAKDREDNALLGEHFEVQRHTIHKPSPIDDDLLLEFIKKGIHERNFDNVVFKVKEKPRSNMTPTEFGNSIKTSLVEDYENLFIKAKALEKIQEDPAREALRLEIIDLFHNLDSLSSLHFIPRPRVDGYNIITNKPALMMEEAGPTASASADLLAPEEVFEPRGEPIKGVSEVTTTDRRRHRKKLMRVRAGKRKVQASISSKSKDRRVALEKVIAMAHKPGSKIRIAK